MSYVFSVLFAFFVFVCLQLRNTEGPARKLSQLSGWPRGATP